MSSFFTGIIATALMRVDITLLVPFAAGNFLYIAASDLIPEVNKHAEAKANLVHLLGFAMGIALLWLAGIAGR